MSLNSNTILFVVNTTSFFLSHRLPLAIAAKNAGFKVHVATSDSSKASLIKAQGFVHHPIALKRSGQNILSDLATFISLVKLFKFINPTLVHLVTIKPVIYGCIAARIVRIKSVVAAISGLGTVFIDNSFRGFFRRLLVLKLYRSAFKHPNLAVIFQNKEDRDLFLVKNLIDNESCNIIRGSGVQISDYPYLPEPDNVPVVVMASRLLKDKGVIEFVESAKILKLAGTDVIFRLIGDPDPDNRSGVSESFLNQCHSEGFVELLGYREDIADQYANANIVCLPSYREGLPKSLIEAAACGRAVVTSDVAGCRDAIINNVTGLLCPVKDPKKLAFTIKKLVEDSNRRQEMGRAGRKLAEVEFAIEHIVKQHLNLYFKLTNSNF